jgi:hypothetical protein
MNRATLRYQYNCDPREAPARTTARTGRQPRSRNFVNLRSFAIGFCPKYFIFSFLRWRCDCLDTVWHGLESVKSVRERKKGVTMGAQPSWISKAPAVNHIASWETEEAVSARVVIEMSEHRCA